VLLLVSLVTMALVLLASGSAAQAASIWTPINSGTTDTISSIVYQSPTRFWYATTNGKIEYYNAGTFIAGAGPSPGTNFTDLAFQPVQPGTAGGPGTAGLYGYAVASDGSIWQTADGGVNWTSIARPNTYSDCSSSATLAPESELNAIVWANSTTAYLLGSSSTVLKSLNAASAIPNFMEINKLNSGTCADQNQTLTRNLADAVFLASNPLDGFMVSQFFGAIYSTSNGFTSGTPLSEMINQSAGNPRIAQDAANPNRIWVVDHGAGGAGCLGSECFALSTDGAQTYSHPTYPQYANTGTSPTLDLYDISSQGGTEVAAGSAGEIFNSVDGTNFYNQPAAGSLATENWRAEDAYDSADAAVGGQGGALVITSQANSIPDIIPPTGTIAGPTTVTSGQAVTYTASVADNAGGSGINPGGYTWTVPGLAAQHGSSATYTFPSGTGSARITLTFADNAGNQATATLDVTVNNAPPPAPPGPPFGSSPTTSSTGGATVTIYKKVTVTGRRGRFIPVVVKSKKGRRFVITLLTVKGHHHVVPAVKVTLRKGGKKTVHVNIPSKVKSGKYLLAVRVFSLSGHALGRKISVLFILV
jgi:hypothetical protein